MSKSALEIINETRDNQTTHNIRHQIRLADYLRAIETGDVERYHDYQDVAKGKMRVADYEKKWNRHYVGSKRARFKGDDDETS